MKTGIYAIKDACNGFNVTFNASNNSSAMRMFSEWCQNENSMYNKYPNDFDLYKLGDLDEETGNINPDCALLERATAFVKNKSEEA